MSQRNAQRTSVLPLLLLVASCCQPGATGYGPWTPDKGFSEELQRQQYGGNGIEVGDPKIYDDTSLRLMLDAAKNRLATINSFNEGALTTRLGAINGSRIDQSQLGIQVTGGTPLPGTSTVANGPTSQTTTNTNPPGFTPVSPTQTVVTTQPSQAVTTTVAPTAAPAAPTVPAGLAFTPPSGLSGSALDVLNEEMQLNGQITGLELLLEGALSDRFIINQHFVKPRATIGFPITLTPQPRYRNAVAVVEVEVTEEHTLAPEPPAVTVILPQEKTYNVAAITDKMTSIGAGVVVGALGASGSFAWGRKTYYVVQDQDTVAIQWPSIHLEEKGEVGKQGEQGEQHANTARFAWEFRPVLGREFVQGGMKQTFVQLAFPKLTSSTPDCFGKIKVRTYWRHFDPKTGISGEVIQGSILAREAVSVPRYDLTPAVDDVAYQDLGDGTVRVKVISRDSFLSGTYVQLGPARYDTGAGLLADDTGLSFVAPAAALARWTGKVVSRNGLTTAILQPDPDTASARSLDQLSCAGVAPKAAPAPAKMNIDEVITLPNATEVEIRMSGTQEQSAAGVGLIDARTANRLDLAGSQITSSDAGHAVMRAAVGQGSQHCRQGSIAIRNVEIKPYDDSSSRVKVELEAEEHFFKIVRLDIGHQVFGLADTDALVRREYTPTKPCVDAIHPCITAIVPNALLKTGRRVRAFVLFKTDPEVSEKWDQNRCFSSVWPLDHQADHLGLDAGVESTTLLAVDAKKNATYLLVGHGMADAVVISPPSLKLTPLPNVPPDRMATLKVPKSVLAANKKLLLQMHAGDPPLVLDLPSPDPAAKPKPPKVAIDSPVIQNTDTMKVSVEKVAKLRSVTMDGSPLTYTVVTGKDAILLQGLRAAGVTSEQKTRVLTFTFNDGTKDGTKVPVTLEVVAERVGVKSLQ